MEFQKPTFNFLTDGCTHARTMRTNMLPTFTKLVGWKENKKGKQKIFMIILPLYSALDIRFIILSVVSIIQYAC